MNIPAIRTALDAVLIPTTIRTLGSEKAVSLLEERSDGLHIGLKFAFPVAHIAADIANAVQEAVISHTGDTHIHLSIDTEIGTHKVQPGVATIKGVKNIIAVASGKGGVGKSTTTANLATAMARMGARVGVLDADLYGPSQPTMLGVQDRKPDQQNKKLIPVEAESGIQVMSIGFLVDTDQAVVWRGPMVSQALQQLIENLVDEQQRHKVAYATEGGQFTNAGIPTVICGPGDIGNAHKANEFVSLNQLAKCESFLQQILQQCCDSH